MYYNNKDSKNDYLNKYTHGEALVSALLTANSYHDAETTEHIVRLGKFAADFAKYLHYDSKFIQKIGLPGQLIHKPGKFSEEEFCQMQQHVKIGAHILSHKDIDPFAKNIALYHHEKWDGSGYIYHLSARDIPQEAQIISIVDVYDALRHERSYKPAYTYQQAVEILESSKDTHFDKSLVEIFIKYLIHMNHHT